MPTFITGLAGADIAAGAAIATGFTYLRPDKRGDPKSGEAVRVKVLKEVQRSAQDVLNDPGGDPGKALCESIGRVGTHFAIVGEKLLFSPY